MGSILATQRWRFEGRNRERRRRRNPVAPARAIGFHARRNTRRSAVATAWCGVAARAGRGKRCLHPPRPPIACPEQRTSTTASMSSSTAAPPLAGIPVGTIDCDVHINLPSTRALLPYFDPYWREHITRRGLERESLDTTSFPANAPINGRPDWRPANTPPGSTLGALQSHVLDHFQLRHAIGNVLNGAQVIF